MDARGLKARAIAIKAHELKGAGEGATIRGCVYGRGFVLLSAGTVERAADCLTADRSARGLPTVELR